ncbi:GNAT family N-acetyltransferase [Gluconacetobacter tumulisoli]|uniref:GNAT family N-acetyltransferase n=2 Tax=Gluconacetobacter tumulisoli TaxID=1286189 RepID=A0A7W4KAF0_9PROT|nr:GNAT family N-acetyltransferase [Gluconacetobacter tumulisoli]MBB2203326.1 GNAT family N-acetyltransferase [Gluconacetobacter tumulisoli]
MRACEAELAVTAAAIAAGRVQVAERDGRVVGMAQIAPDGPAAELDKLFVEPDAMGGGAGRALFDWAVTAARHAGARTMTIDADPGAAAFYRRMGAMDDGMVPSGSIAGRMLPRLRMDM